MRMLGPVTSWPPRGYEYRAEFASDSRVQAFRIRSIASTVLRGNFFAMIIAACTSWMDRSASEFATALLEAGASALPNGLATCCETALLLMFVVPNR